MFRLQSHFPHVLLLKPSSSQRTALSGSRYISTLLLLSLSLSLNSLNAVVLFVKGLSQAIADGSIKNGDTLEVDLDTGDIHDVDTGATVHGDAVSDLEHDIMEAGGLFQYMKAQQH